MGKGSTFVGVKMVRQRMEQERMEGQGRACKGRGWKGRAWISNLEIISTCGNQSTFKNVPKYEQSDPLQSLLTALFKCGL